ncbi:hypothetical protein EV361DRAFT_963860 [Lentinula raphanica]|nr:hypothetical protein EV361DRAFT_963860 [Lentinula raphanica]
MPAQLDVISVYSTVLYAAVSSWSYGSAGKGESVSVKENRTEIENEGIRLHHLQTILDEFRKHAKKERVDIAGNITVTDYKIALEVVGDAGPLPASGVVMDLEESQLIGWLLEPMRPKTAITKKWSGTMQHPEHNNKVGDTLTSLVHFGYSWTHKSLVFADLQTTKIGGTTGGLYVLFDVMCHTMVGDSGVGDHGLEGIKTFVGTHICEKKCRDLGLEVFHRTKQPQRHEDKESSDDEDA